MIGNKIPDRITKVAKTSWESNSETVKNEHDEEISKERYLSAEGSSGRKAENYRWSQINIMV